MQCFLVLVGARSCLSATCPRKTGEDSSRLAISRGPRFQCSSVSRAFHSLPDGAVLVHCHPFQTQQTCSYEVFWGPAFPPLWKTRTSILQTFQLLHCNMKLRLRTQRQMGHIKTVTSACVQRNQNQDTMLPLHINCLLFSSRKDLFKLLLHNLTSNCCLLLFVLDNSIFHHGFYNREDAL